MNKRAATLLMTALLAGSILAACGEATPSPASTEPTADVGAVDQTALDLGAVGTLASSVTHTIDVSFDATEYAGMLETYQSTGDKEWLEATVTIDGAAYERAGIRLKGNSSLFDISSADDPASLPWLIELDKYVEGQSHDGLTDLVVRSNDSETALNEAVALELLDAAGLASQDAIATVFSVGGGASVLRLVIDHPDDLWMAEEFSSAGALFKAESTGDYSYRGEDPGAYEEVFDQEAGKDTTDLSPLIDFLDFINNADDATFDAELGDWFEVDAFATYLAMQELIDNFDDIDGPGNNSYLFYDVETARFTVVAWDHNLAFGLGPWDAGAGDGGFAGAPPGRAGDRSGALPDGIQPPDDRPAGETGGAGSPERPEGPGTGGNVGNVLVERFLANPSWASLVDSRAAELRSELYESGLADEILEAWSKVVASPGLVDADTVASETTQIQKTFSSQ